MRMDLKVVETANGTLVSFWSAVTDPPVVAESTPSSMLYCTAWLGSVVVYPPAFRYVLLSACLFFAACPIGWISTAKVAPLLIEASENGVGETVTVDTITVEDPDLLV